MLKVSNLHAYYGKSHVLHGVDMHVREGEIVALLGRNGSGRSTTAKAIMGLVDCHGSALWKGQEALGKKTFEIAHLGVGYVPESRDIFPKLTVHQNLLLGQKRGQKNPRWSFDDMYKMFPRLKGLAPKIVELVAEYLKELRKRGVSVLLIEQKLTIAMQISDRCFVMGHGSIVFEGTPEELRNNSEIRKEWLEV